MTDEERVSEIPLDLAGQDFLTGESKFELAAHGLADRHPSAAIDRFRRPLGRTVVAAKHQTVAVAASRPRTYLQVR
jgi:hypothetical protein